MGHPGSASSMTNPTSSGWMRLQASLAFVPPTSMLTLDVDRKVQRAEAAGVRVRLIAFSSFLKQGRNEAFVHVLGGSVMGQHGGHGLRQDLPCLFRCSAFLIFVP